MSEDSLHVEDLLKHISLFYDLDDSQLSHLVDRLETIYLEEGELLFSEGEMGDSMYILFEGEVLVTRGRGDEEVVLATMGSGDHFGEEAILYDRPRSASVRAVAPTTLLRINAELYSEMVQQTPGFHPTLETSAQSHQLSRKMNFDWLNPGENIYLLARKHPAVLWISLSTPVFVGLLSIPAFFLAYLSETYTPLLCGVLLVVAAIGWAIWRVIDWTNDYYLVTNQRVVWLEKIVGIYDSRQEAPLRTLLSVSVETDPFGRVFGYGDVIVRTYTSRVIIGDVGQPQEFASLVEQYWMRTKEQIQHEDSEEMVRILRDELGLPSEEPPGDTFPEESPANGPGNRPSQEQLEQPSVLRLVWANYFQMRYQQGSVITYRKHWWILIKKTWFPALCVFLILALMAISAVGTINLFSGRTMSVAGIALLMVFGGWWLYRFIDWRNDMYQLTADHIVDIDRKPLGSEQKQAAPIENILSLEHERIGITALLFNYGTVIARIGKTDFTFDNVHDPARVQQDIFARMDERINQKRKLEIGRERTRLASWLATYHRNVEEFRNAEELLDEEEEQELNG